VRTENARIARVVESMLGSSNGSSVAGEDFDDLRKGFNKDMRSIPAHSQLPLLPLMNTKKIIPSTSWHHGKECSHLMQLRVPVHPSPHLSPKQ
jgi:hypothetical protein